jgi:hypothetical protein
MLKWCLPLALLLALACATQSKQGWVEGGLYSTQNDDGNISIVKILKLDDQGVHVRVYSNRFDSHPSKIDESALYMAGMNRSPNEQLGLGHLPLSRDSFAAWRPRYLKTVPVDKAELEGYEMWKEGGGGYF